jgi:FkbM family methyltransferase
MAGEPVRERATSALRRLGGTRMLLPLSARVLCANLVRERAAFFAREVSRPAGMHLYRLRENGLTVGVRHDANDSATLAEVFRSHDYVPPPDVDAALAEPATIVDLGANVGFFGAYAAARWPSASIVGYEPDPDNADVHERTIAANGLGARWRVVRAAAGAHEGHVSLAAGRAMASFVAAPGSDPGGPVINVPIVDVIARIGDADLVKMDVEGGEWEILLDPRFTARPPRALVLEYHPHLCPHGDPRESAERALAAASLRTTPIWHHADGCGMLWAWRA